MYILSSLGSVAACPERSRCLVARPAWRFPPPTLGWIYRAVRVAPKVRVAGCCRGRLGSSPGDTHPLRRAITAIATRLHDLSPAPAVRDDDSYEIASPSSSSCVTQNREAPVHF